MSADSPIEAQETLQPAGSPNGWRRQLFRTVFESDTPAGVLFDKVLVGVIIASLLTVVLDSVPDIHNRWAGPLNMLEWGFTLLFTAEYLLRLVCLRQPLRYVFSFYGIVDLLALFPTYLALILPNLHVLVDVRVFRLLRIFRIFKLTAYISEFQHLSGALLASWRKIAVFLSVVIMLVIVMGSVMYVVEGPQNGFTSIPTSIYWAITTMTTVGFGDIAPRTGLGRLISSMMMLVGWGTLAVPTGIVTSELSSRRPRGRPCPACGEENVGTQAKFCWNCGAPI